MYRTNNQHGRSDIFSGPVAYKHDEKISVRFQTAGGARAGELDDGLGKVETLGVYSIDS